MERRGTDEQLAVSETVGIVISLLCVSSALGGRIPVVIYLSLYLSIILFSILYAQ